MVPCRVDLTTLAQRQLDATYDRINHDQQISTAIRNWCVTVWVGTLVLIHSDNIELSDPQRSLIPLLPILFFWLQDSITCAFIQFHKDRARSLEELMIDPSGPEVNGLRALMLQHRDGGTSIRSRAIGVIRVAFLAESLVLFYVGLLAMSLVAAWLD